MNRRTLILLGVIVVSSVTLGFFSLTRGQSWAGDDFASYVLQAKSILTGTMGDFIRENTFTIEHSSYPPGPAAYPWGFPVLLAPFYAVFGLNALALKLLNLGMYAVFLVGMFFLARTRLSERDALLLTGFCAYAPALLAANDLILSDVAFLALSTLSLVLIDRLARQNWAAGIAVGAAIFMTFFVRTNGIVLLAPLLLALLSAEWPAWRNALKKALPPVLTFAGLAAVQYAIFPGGQSSYFSHFSMFTLERLADNLRYYVWLPARAFDQIPGGAALYPLTAVFLLASLYAHFRRDAAMHAYGLLTILLFIAWPERQDLRFIYPVLPFMLIAGFDGMRLAAGCVKTAWQGPAQRVVSIFWGVLVIAVLVISSVSAWQISTGGREINGPFDPVSNQVFSYVREKTPSGSIIIFRKPRALRLFTGRNAFMTENCADLPGGDYLVIHLKAENGQVAPEQVGSCNPSISLDEVFRNRRFIVYKITP